MKQADPAVARMYTWFFWREVVRPLLIAAGYSVGKWGVMVERIEVNGLQCWEFSVMFSDIPKGRPYINTLVFRSIRFKSGGGFSHIDDVVHQALEYLHATESGVNL